MQPQIALPQPRRHGGMRAQIAQLLDDVSLRQREQKLQTGSRFFVLRDRSRAGWA